MAAVLPHIFRSTAQNYVYFFRCPYNCDFTNRIYSTVTKHIEQKHERLLVLQCNRCTFVCQFKNIMSQHIKYTHEVSRFDVDSFIVKDLGKLRACQKMMVEKEHDKESGGAKAVDQQSGFEPGHELSLTGIFDL